MADTKFCDGCGKEIGKSETKCPACQADLAELDEIASAVEKGQAILEARKKRATPPVVPPTSPEPLKGLARLRAIGRKKGA